MKYLMLTGTEKGSGVQQRMIYCCTPLRFSVVGLDPLQIQTDNGSGLQSTQDGCCEEREVMAATATSLT